MKGFYFVLMCLFVSPLFSRDHNPIEQDILSLMQRGTTDEIFRFFDTYGDLNTPLSTNDNLYSMAFTLEDPERRHAVVKALFEAGASLNLTNRKGLSPEEEAEKQGLNQIVRDLRSYRQELQDALFAELELFTEKVPRYLTIRDLLVRGAGVLEENQDGLTPCQLVVVGGYPEILRLLLEYTDDTHPFEKGLDDFNRYLLFFAIAHSPETSLELTRLLLDLGFSPDLADPDGNPLLTESLYSSLEVTKLLLDAGADTELRDFFGVTALMRAGALERGADALTLLLEYGANLQVEDEDGWNALYYTVLFGGTREAVEILIRNGMDLNSCDSYGSSVMLWAAAYRRDVDMLRFLEEKGASPNSRDKDGWIPLMAALNWANEQAIVEYLIERVPDGRIKDGCGRSLDSVIRVYEEKTGHPVPGNMAHLLNRRVYPPDSIPCNDLNLALHETSEWGRDPSMISALIAAGGDINAPDRDGWTPLMKASAYNSSAMVRAILNAGGDGAYKNDRGWTALHMAAWSDDPATTLLLLERSAFADAPDREGWTPFLWAARNQAPPEVFRALMAAGANPVVCTGNSETALYLMVSGWKSPDPEGLRILLDTGIDPDRGNYQGITPLMKAAALGYGQATRALLEAGADPDREDSKGNRAEDYAVSQGFSEIARILKGE